MQERKPYKQTMTREAKTVKIARCRRARENAMRQGVVR